MIQLLKYFSSVFTYVLNYLRLLDNNQQDFQILLLSAFHRWEKKSISIDEENKDDVMDHQIQF